jgi:hypothetical protein
MILSARTSRGANLRVSSESHGVVTRSLSTCEWSSLKYFSHDDLVSGISIPGEYGVCIMNVLFPIG